MTVKISELTEATLPLVGSEEVLLVQAGTTKRAPINSFASFSGVTSADLASGPTVDDLSIASFDTEAVAELSSDADVDLTGIADGAGGMTRMLVNVGLFNIQLMIANTGSAAGNRFGGNGDYLIVPGAGVIIYYSATLAAWVILGV